MDKGTKNWRIYQRKARAYNIPDILLKHAKLIPLYIMVEGLCMETGECFAGDEYLAKVLEVDKTTVVRQRVKLEALGLIFRRGKGNTRKLQTWPHKAAALQKAGDLKAIEEILHRAVGQPLQAELDLGAEEPPSKPQGKTVPSDEFIAAQIQARYPAKSYHHLGGEDEQRLWRNEWQLNSVVDLLWLFDQEITEEVYRRFKSLNTQQRAKVIGHAPQYAWANRGQADFMMNLDNYLDARNPGWRKRIRDFASKGGAQGGNKRGSRTGLNQQQASWLQQKMG